jgi:hypothetical protein
MDPHGVHDFEDVAIDEEADGAAEQADAHIIDEVEPIHVMGRWPGGG